MMLRCRAHACVCSAGHDLNEAPSHRNSVQVSKEVEEHGDIVLVREKTNYKSILLKTFFVLEYAIKHYDVRYILKTDDDAYVHVEALVHQLKLLCISPDCR